MSRWEKHGKTVVLDRLVYAVGRQISWSWSHNAGGRKKEGENIEKNDGRTKKWSPCIDGRLAEVVARTGSTVFCGMQFFFWNLQLKRL